MTHPRSARQHRSRDHRGDRFRRYRARVAAGRRVARVEYDGATLDLLISMHWLSEADAADARKVGDAIAHMLEDAARARR
jgi:hypothetical protein